MFCEKRSKIKEFLKFKLSFFFRITAPENERIELEFVDFLLFNNQIEDCAAQSLTIRDPLSDSPIGKYCGNTKPPNYTTMGNSLFMVLDSNTDGEYKVKGI